MTRDEMLATLRQRLLDGVMDRVDDVLVDLADDDLRALLKATEGHDPVAQALSERFVFRKAAEKAMKSASTTAVTRAAETRSAQAARADGAAERDDASAAADRPNELKWS